MTARAVSQELLLLMVLKMFDNILSMLLVAGFVVIVYLTSCLCERRVQKFTDEFCKAYLEASDHILKVPLNGEKLMYSIALPPSDTAAFVNFRGKGKRNEKKVLVTLKKLEEQPEALRKLFEKGIDDFIVERFKTMHRNRDGAQLNFAPLNMIEKRYNSALNRIYDIANLSFRALEDFSVLKTKEDVDDFHFFLYKQDFIRNTILASIISKDAKKRMIDSF